MIGLGGFLLTFIPMLALSGVTVFAACLGVFHAWDWWADR